MVPIRVGPIKDLIPLHLINVFTSALALYLFDFNNLDSPPSIRIWLVLGCFVLSQTIGLMATCYLSGKKTPGPRDGRRRRAAVEASRPVSSDSWLHNVRNDFLCVALSVVSFHIITILLGAYVIEHTGKTAALSCLLTLFTMVNLVGIKPKTNIYAKLSQTSHPLNGVNVESTDEPSILDRILLSFPLQLEDPVENFLITHCYIVLAGAWFGVFPIKLDWNEPWQEFPVTCFAGAIVANLISHSLHLIYVLTRFVLCRKW